MNFDWKSPDYPAAFANRIDRLKRIRAEPECLPFLKNHYRDHPADFIRDWGITVNPKNVERGLPSVVPFILYPKQEEWIGWVVDHWRNQRPGITEKTRQMGFSWLTMALGCTLCLFHEGFVGGIGSRKQEYVDVIGDIKSLIQKGREFMRNLPVEFRGGWNIKDHAPHMRLMFPETGSILAGEAGDNIGRGNTTSLYWVDESAFLERPQLVESSLSQTTNCRIDISTPNGMGNAFAQKRFSGKIDVFSFHWRDDPSKDDIWYQKQASELDPVTLAQELDINYSASVEGILIPSVWVQAAVNAHAKLGIVPTGARSGALDVADEGRDLNAFCGAHGILIEFLEEWSGKGDDIYGTVQRAFGLCGAHEYPGFKYDADGLGAGVRGDARVINEKLPRGQQLAVDPFRGSGPVVRPDAEDVKGRKNQDFFANFKAQSWWSLRTRFQKTHRAVADGQPCPPDELISISSAIPDYLKLVSELSQPTYSISGTGKIVVDKAPDGTRSPNLADAVMIRFSPAARLPMSFSPAAAARLSAR